MPASATFVLSAVGGSTPLPVLNDMLTTQFLPPSVLCFVSAGAVLTYSIEVTADKVNAAGYLAANTVWVPMDSMNGLTGSANAVLQGAVNAMRARITAYTSGTLTAAFCWSAAR